MTCNTCGHTMQSIADAVHWCPRCGSMKRRNLHTVEQKTDSHVPKLVARCRAFEAEGWPVNGSCTEAWKRLGISESINLPEARPSC